MTAMGGSLRLPAAHVLVRADGRRTPQLAPVSEIRRSCSGTCHSVTPLPWKINGLAAARDVLTMGDR
jgi:hypothetical protein